MRFVSSLMLLSYWIQQKDAAPHMSIPPSEKAKHVLQLHDARFISPATAVSLPPSRLPETSQR